MSNYFNGSGTIGFTCDNCGRELLGCTWVNGMKFCAKCYQETFGNTNHFEKELRDKISDLETKLAEHNEYFRSFSCENFNEFQDFISTFMLTPHEEQTLIRELKQQLAEKDQDKIEFAIEQLEAIRGNILCNEVFFDRNVNKLVDYEIDDMIKRLKEGK